MLGSIVLEDFPAVKSLCGDGGLQNVIIATSKWGPGAMPEGIPREEELHGNQFFKRAIDGGARLLRYDGTPESAREILRMIILDKAELSRMREMTEKHNNEIGQLEERMQAMGREKEELRRELDEEKRNSREMMERHNREIGKLEEAMQAIGREKEELRGELDKEKRTSKEMVEKHDKEIERLERGMRAMEELRRELDEEKKDLEEEVEELKGSVAEMQAEMLKERQNRKGWGWMVQFGWGATGGETDKIPSGVEREGRGSDEASPGRTRRVVSVRRTFDRLDRSSTDFGHKLNEVLHTPKYKEWMSTLKKDDLMWFIDYLDMVRRPCIPP